MLTYPKEVISTCKLMMCCGTIFLFVLVLCNSLQNGNIKGTNVIWVLSTVLCTKQILTQKSALPIGAGEWIRCFHCLKGFLLLRNMYFKIASDLLWILLPLSTVNFHVHVFDLTSFLDAYTTSNFPTYTLWFLWVINMRFYEGEGFMGWILFLKSHMLNPELPISHNLIVFGVNIFKKVIMKEGGSNPVWPLSLEEGTSGVHIHWEKAVY